MIAASVFLEMLLAYDENQLWHLNLCGGQRLKSRKLLFGALVVGILVCVSPVFGSTPGLPAPNIYGRDMDKSLFRLSDLKQDVILINFFWVQCIPCRKELPELAHLEAEFPDAKFLAIHVEDEDTHEVQNFLAGLSAYPANVVMASPMVKKSYSIPGLPYTVLIKGGFIDSTYVGYTEAGFLRLVNRLHAIYD